MWGQRQLTVVGICLERSLEIIVGLVDVLKAGGAYLPLAPLFPEERLAFMLQDARVSMLLTQQRLVERLPKHHTHLICLDTDWEVVAQESGEKPITEVSIENLAYVLFTSGSTGRPKGVPVEHRQIINYLNSILERLDLSNDASFAMVTTFAADSVKTVIFSALCTGGSLHIISRECAADPDALAEHFLRRPVDCLKTVPSHLQVLLTASHPEWILPRQRLVLGGEACRWDLVEKLQMLTPDCSLLNQYGPTETTVAVTTYQLALDLSTEQIENNKYDLAHSKASTKVLHSKTLQIGRPIANTQTYVLDSYLQPVPIGVPGELYIGGNNVTRGYLNRPEATAERFIPNPFNGETGSCLYRTGDLVRYLSTGDIEFLGRVDHQVKIRGFRVELGEIEATLNQHAAVQETIAIVWEAGAGTDDKRLVMYVVAKQELAPTANELGRFMKQRLPDYMIPSSFVFLEALPLTPSGKIDRRALPVPDITGLETAYIPPRNPIEETLTSIWTEVLGVDKVGIHDNFFDLGGHSLLATQIISRANSTLQINLSLANLFESPTVDRLAELVEKADNYGLTKEGQRIREQSKRATDQHFFVGRSVLNKNDHLL